MGSVLGMLQALPYSDQSIRPTLTAIAIVQSLQESPTWPGTSPTGEGPVIAPITPEWALNLIATAIEPYSCILPAPLQKSPGLEISSRNETTVNFTWDPVPALNNNGTFNIGWASWLQEPVYTPVVLTSRSSGTATLPLGLRGFVVAVLTEKTPDNIYDLTAVALSGPVMAEIIS